MDNAHILIKSLLTTPDALAIVSNWKAGVLAAYRLNCLALQSSPVRGRIRSFLSFLLSITQIPPARLNLVGA